MVNEIMQYISRYDPEVGQAVEAECGRQRRAGEIRDRFPLYQS